MTTSEVLDDHPLNTSDHLAVCAVIEVNPIQTWKDNNRIPRVNWGKAATDQPAWDEGIPESN
jgi:hypothetical protein